jgi:hypothetical protein
MKHTEKELRYMKEMGDDEYREPREPILCADGFSMSVQGNQFAYCTPRISDSRYYTRVEVGFPSERDELLMPHIDSAYEYNKETDEYDIPADPTGTVYPYTPAEVVMAVIQAHGGMVRGELPPLKLIQDEEEEE